MIALKRSIALLCVVIAWPLLAAGYLLPLIELKKLKFFTDTPSLLSVIAGLADEKDYFLASILVVFTLIFPISKLTLLSALVLSPKSQFAPITKWLARLGKWSMLDVLILAVSVYAAHKSGLASVASQPGAWCFALSVILAAFAAEFIPQSSQITAQSSKDSAANPTLSARDKFIQAD